METISLSGAWRLMPLDRNECRAYTSCFDDRDFIEYNNSNSIYTTLANSVKKHEIDSLRKLKWVLERTFDIALDERRSVLLSHGIINAEINGEKCLGSEITSLLKDGENTIRLTVTSSFRSPVEILRSHDGVGYSAHLNAKKDKDEWIVTAVLDYEAFREHEKSVKVSLLGHDCEESLRFEKGRKKYSLTLLIPLSEAETWSIRGDGRQIMYTALVTVGSTTLERRIAFRTIEVKNGLLYVNGRETFIMGALWPNKILSDQKRYDELLSSAAWANMNALYIEEGHETHEFYNTCDHLGLIVLHSAMYEDYKFHPSFVGASIDIDIFKAEASEERGYLGLALDAVSLERWTLKTRSVNSKPGVLYSDLLSTVRENGTWRPGHYAARRFFADLVPIMFIEDDALKIYVSNDGDKEEKVEISVKFMTYSGGKRNKWMYSDTVKAHEALMIQSLDLRGVDRKNEFVYIKLRTFSIHRELTLLLDDIEKCSYQKVAIETEIREINARRYSIRLMTNKPAFAVHLEMEGTKGNFSDSFFEVRPASEKSVIFSSAEDLSAEYIKDHLKIYDLASAVLDK